MPLFTDSFDGAADTLLSTRTGWVAGTGYYDVLALNGTGAVKRGTYSDDGVNVFNQTGSASHYVKVVVGAGFVSSAGSIAILVCAAARSDNFGISLESNGDLEIRINGNSIITTIAGQAVLAGDTLELRWDAETKTLTAKKNATQIYSGILSEYPKTSTNTGIYLSYNGQPAADDVFRSWESGALADEVVPDTTPPTLTLPTVTATGTTTVIGGITTNEAGPAWAILSTSATKPTAAQIKAGQNHLGTASPAATATLVVGANPSAFDFSGLTPNTGYYLHVVQDDTAVPANTSTVATSATVTTDTPLYPIITLPVLKNNTGTLLADVVGATVHVYAVATGNKVVTKTGQTSNASAVMAITDPALVAGTEYRCVIVLASGAEGLQKATAA